MKINAKKLREIVKTMDILSRKAEEYQSGAEELPAIAVYGAASCGKTQMARQMAKELGRELIVFPLFEMVDMGDLAFPVVINGELRWTHDFVVDPEKKYLLFFDELNRAAQELMRPCFRLISERRIKDTAFPRDTLSIIAMNPPTDEYDTSEIEDVAKKSRMLEFYMETTVNDWVEHESGRFEDLDFLSKLAVDIQMEKEYEIRKTPIYRMMTFLNIFNKHRGVVEEAMQINNLHKSDLFKIITIGALGTEAGAQVLSNLEMQKPHIKYEKLIKMYRSSPTNALKEFASQKAMVMYASLLDIKRHGDEIADPKFLIDVMKAATGQFRAMAMRMFVNMVSRWENLDNAERFHEMAINDDELKKVLMSLPL